MNILSRKAVATAAAVGLVFIAGVVLAGTITNNAPGSSCVYAGGGGTLNVRTDGEVENTSTTAFALAVCPIDRPISPTTTQLSGTVFAVDRNASSDVCCWVVSKNPDGTAQNGTSKCTTGSSTSYQQLALPGITDSTTYSHFYVICSLPPASGTATSRLQTIRSIQQ